MHVDSTIDAPPYSFSISAFSTTQEGESFHQLAVFIVNALVLIGAFILSPSASGISTLADNAGGQEISLVPLVPVVGIILYMGLVSGYIPSPLYERHERWPKEYAIFQLIMLLMTASRLTQRADNPEELPQSASMASVNEYNIEELAKSTPWLDSDLHSLLYSDSYDDLLEIIADVLLWLGIPVVLSYVARRIEWLNKFDESKNLPLTVVFLRNVFLSVCICAWFIWEELNEDEGELRLFCVQEYSTLPGMIAPNYPLSKFLSSFSNAWKVFHLSDLWLVRLSHAILYPSIMLCFTRRRLSLFFIWVMFIEIDVFQMLADMFHYSSGPTLAMKRLDFQREPNVCYVNVQLLRTFVAYPLNFLYLTTSLGDTHTDSVDI